MSPSLPLFTIDATTGVDRRALFRFSYDIMSQCWCENPAHRPTFSAIREQLDELLGHHRNYLDLDNFGPCRGTPPAAQMDANSETAILNCDSDDEDDDDEMSSAVAGLLAPGGMRPFGTTTTSSAVDEYERMRPSLMCRPHVSSNDEDAHYLQASEVLLTPVDHEEPAA